jgi:hypothetical protein
MDGTGLCSSLKRAHLDHERTGSSDSTRRHLLRAEASPAAFAHERFPLLHLVLLLLHVSSGHAERAFRL